MTTYSADAVRTDIEALVRAAGLTWDDFLRLGESDELLDISEDLDFAYRALVPLLNSPA